MDKYLAPQIFNLSKSSDAVEAYIFEFEETMNLNSALDTGH